MATASCTIRHRVSVGVDQAWQRLCSLERHTAAIPFTTLTSSGGESHLAEGMAFTARTVIGPLGFDDRMVVEELTAPNGQQPGHLVIRKLGRWLGGRTEATIAADAAGGCRVTWVQDISSPLLPQWLKPLGAVVTRFSYRAGVRRIIGS